MRIGLIGDLCTLPTGYGKQIFELGTQLLLKGHVTANFAYQHIGPPREVNGIEVYSFQDVQAQRSAYIHFKPEVVVHVRDNWALIDPGRAKVPLRNQAQRHQSKFIAYTPIDNTFYPREFVESISTESDLTLVTTDWGIQVLCALGTPRSRLARLYPGVNPEVFSRNQPDGKAREFFGLPPEVPIIVQVATNWVSQRKMQPTVVLAFKSFLERYDSDAILYIHSPSRGYFDLEAVVKSAGLWGKGRVALSNRVGAGGHMEGVGEAEIADLYRTASALVSLSSAEGFNSPMAEAASCGLATVVTDFPVHREVLSLWKDRHEAYFVSAQKILPHPYGYEWLADYEAAADMLATAIRRPHGKGGVPEELAWSHLATELADVCQGLL